MRNCVFVCLQSRKMQRSRYEPPLTAFELWHDKLRLKIISANSSQLEIAMPPCVQPASGMLQRCDHVACYMQLVSWQAKNTRTTMW